MYIILAQQHYVTKIKLDCDVIIVGLVSFSFSHSKGHISSSLLFTLGVTSHPGSSLLGTTGKKAQTKTKILLCPHPAHEYCY